ncbi:hypothetical protein MBORA_12850 [Methanobrevibacter oralis]|uniref:Uncharacterized protein n=2 Tax=Methanobrevibacter oralis TaxID=66851 RepID=A0A166ALW8_METOA|nr:hypothetical protein [Methanobrevibacter oralis]KZX12209.1 hypothetical protein MBORA_12850 [Methanobrevibacter oralis]
MEKNQKIIIGALVVIIAVIAIVGAVMFIDDMNKQENHNSCRIYFGK